MLTQNSVNSADVATIRVVCRFRPQNGREIREGGRIVVDVDKSKTTATVQVFIKEMHSCSG